MASTNLTPAMIVEKFGDKKFALLKVAFDQNMPQEIVDLYKQHITKHNIKQYTDPYPDAGFDLFVPENEFFHVAFKTEFVDFRIKSEMLYYDGEYNPSAFDMVPRSSISKTPLMQANHIGIIDSGYRGNLIGAFRAFLEPNGKYLLEKKTRISQICHPTRCPIYVKIVDESELSSTARGAGGFGSTGV